MVENASEPVVTPPGQGKRNAAGAIGVLALVGIALGGMYLLPKGEDANSQRERAESNKPERDRPGDPGQPLRKPGWEDVPRQEVVVQTEAAKPAVALAEPRRARVRPQPSAVSTWVAPKPSPPVAQATATPAASNEEAKQVKLGGLPVMQAERIDDVSWYLMPGEQIICRNMQPLTEKTGAFWTAKIPEEKLNRDGTRRLIPANSEAFGKIVTGFQNGDRRLSAVITHITTPSVAGKPTLFIPIDMGQVGDDLGRVDMEGNVESNFWGRLGSVGAYAILDAVARGGTSFAGGQLNRALNGGNDGVNVNVGNFGGVTGQSLAGNEYQRQLSKPPEFNRPQSQSCSIMITRPVNFRNALQIGK